MSVSPSHNWQKIGSKKINSPINSEYYSSFRRSEKFKPEGISKVQSESNKKIFRVNSKSKEGLSKLGSKLNQSKQKYTSPEKNSYWKQDESSIKNQLSILGKAGMKTQRSIHEDISQPNHLLDVQRSKTMKIKPVEEILKIQQDYKRFKNQIFKQLKQIQEKINKVITEVLINCQKQIAKFKNSQAMEFEKSKEQLQQIKPFSQVAIPSQAFTLSIKHQSNMQPRQRQRQQQKSIEVQKSKPYGLTTVRSDKQFNYNILQKNEFKKFAQAMRKLKSDIQQNEDTQHNFQNCNFTSGNSYATNKLSQNQ